LGKGPPDPVISAVILLIWGTSTVEFVRLIPENILKIHACTKVVHFLLLCLPVAQTLGTNTPLVLRNLKSLINRSSVAQWWLYPR